MKKKLLIGMIAFFIIAGTATVAYAYNQKVIAKEQETIEKAENAIDALYVDDTRIKLASNLDGKLKNAKKAIELVQDNDVKQELLSEVETVEHFRSVQVKVDSIIKEGVVLSDIDSSKLEKAKQLLVTIKGKNDSIYTSLESKVSTAEAQLNTINKATKKVETAEVALSDKTYQNASSLVKKIKNKSMKDELKTRLDVVNKKIVAIKEEEKRSKEAELAEKNRKSELTKSQEAKAQQSSNNTTASKNNSNQSQEKKNSSSTNNKSSSKSSQKTSKSKDTTKKSTKSSNKGSSTGNSSSQEGLENRDWDKIGDYAENKEWEHKDSGYISGEGGNTWDSYE
ncbi:MAG: hypothetical protein ACQEWU_10155 [Bacillota bacterium]